MQDNLLDRAASVCGDADDLEIAERSEQRGQPGADDGMVVGQHDAYHETASGNEA